jgi:hypothetical protein
MTAFKILEAWDDDMTNRFYEPLPPKVKVSAAGAKRLFSLYFQWVSPVQFPIFTAPFLKLSVCAGGR